MLTDAIGYCLKKITSTYFAYFLFDKLQTNMKLTHPFLGPNLCCHNEFFLSFT